MHILVSAATASDLAETAEQSIDYLQKVIDYVICQCDDHSYHWMVFDQVCL